MRCAWIVGVLASAVVSSQACATPVSVEYRQETLYDLTYHMPGVSIFLDEHYATQEFNFAHYDAYDWGESNEYNQSVSFSFAEDGLWLTSLEGRRVEFSEQPTSYPYHRYSGAIEFGTDNSIRSWDFSYQFDISTAMHATSHASTFNASEFWAPLHNAWLVDGRTTYDSWWWEPTDFGYATRPGRWSVDVSQACYRMVDGARDGDVPCVAPVPLPVPLPLPGLLLAGSMAGLIALRSGSAWRRSRGPGPAARRAHPPIRC